MADKSRLLPNFEHLCYSNRTKELSFSTAQKQHSMFFSEAMARCFYYIVQKSSDQMQAALKLMNLCLYPWNTTDKGPQFRQAFGYAFFSLPGPASCYVLRSPAKAFQDETTLQRRHEQDLAEKMSGTNVTEVNEVICRRKSCSHATGLENHEQRAATEGLWTSPCSKIASTLRGWQVRKVNFEKFRLQFFVKDINFTLFETDVGQLSTGFSLKEMLPWFEPCTVQSTVPSWFLKPVVLVSHFLK